jgi:hypothetical protein
VLGKFLAESTGLLHSEVLGSVLVLLVGVTSLGDSLFAEDGEHSSDSLSHRLLTVKGGDSKLTLILESLTWGWEETLETRSAANDMRCLVSSAVREFSSLFLSSCALTLCILLNLINNKHLHYCQHS